jgi:hypothetical protein
MNVAEYITRHGVNLYYISPLVYGRFYAYSFKLQSYFQLSDEKITLRQDQSVLPNFPNILLIYLLLKVFSEFKLSFGNYWTTPPRISTKSCGFLALHRLDQQTGKLVNVYDSMTTVHLLCRANPIHSTENDE